MTNPGNDKNQFTSEDIRRYISGQMSDTERHALEKAALEDPFLADAIEGMESGAKTTSLNEDFKALQGRLEKRLESKQRKVIAPFYKVAAAALVFLLAGSLSILYFLNKGTDAGPDTMANDLPNRNMPELRSDTSVIMLQPSIDSTENFSAPQGLRAEPLRKSEESVQQPSVSQKADIDVIRPDPELQEVEIMRPRNDQQIMKRKFESDSLQAKNRSTDQTDNFMRDQSSIITQNKSTDTEVREKSSTIGARQNAPTSAPAPRSEQEMKGSGSPAPVSRELQGKAAGVVIRSTKQQTGIARFSIEPVSSDSTGFSPVGSWASYAAQLNPQQPSTRGSSETLLQFRISPQGQPKDLRILKTRDRSKSAEIVRLVQNGPLWQVKPGKDSTVKVLIRF